MKRVRTVTRVLVLLALALGLTSGAHAGPAAGDPPLPVTRPQGAPQGASALGIVSHNLNFQGLLTTPDGQPVADAGYNVTFKLYNVGAAGVALATDAHPVTTARGLFNTALNFAAALDDINGQELWVGITLEGSPEMSNRIPVRPVPYALGLRPGARIQGVATGSGPGEAILSTSSTSTNANTAALHGRAGADVAAGPSEESGVFGESGAGFGVIGVSTSGMGVVGYSQLGRGIYGTSEDGPGIMGYSSHAAAIAAYGRITSTARSYVWVSGNSLVKESSDDTTRWDNLSNGSARVYRGAAPGIKIVYYPVTMPSVLYGQAVRLTQLTVYYRCQNAANGFITLFQVVRQDNASTGQTIAADGTDLTSTTPNFYSLTTPGLNSVLSANQGALGVHFSLQFADDASYVQIGGIRLELAHD